MIATPGFDDTVSILRKKGITDPDEILSWLVANNRKLWVGETEHSPLSAILAGNGAQVAMVAMFYARPNTPEVNEPTPPPSKVVNSKDYRSQKDGSDKPPPLAA